MEAYRGFSTLLNENIGLTETIHHCSSTPEVKVTLPGAQLSSKLSLSEKNTLCSIGHGEDHFIFRYCSDSCAAGL